MDNLVGQTLNRYKITAMIGEGGMGAVFKAIDMALERDVACARVPQHVSPPVLDAEHSVPCELRRFEERRQPFVQPRRSVAEARADRQVTELMEHRADRVGAAGRDDAQIVAVGVPEAQLRERQAVHGRGKSVLPGRP